MKAIIVRSVSGILGLIAATIAIAAPIRFILNSLNEADSVGQKGGHFSIAGAVGGSLVVVVLAAFFAFHALRLLRFAFRGPKIPPTSIQ